MKSELGIPVYKNALKVGLAGAKEQADLAAPSFVEKAFGSSLGGSCEPSFEEKLLHQLQ